MINLNKSHHYPLSPTEAALLPRRNFSENGKSYFTDYNPITWLLWSARKLVFSLSGTVFSWDVALNLSPAMSGSTREGDYEKWTPEPPTDEQDRHLNHQPCVPLNLSLARSGSTLEEKIRIPTRFQSLRVSGRVILYGVQFLGVHLYALVDYFWGYFAYTRFLACFLWSTFSAELCI